jgi:hypothetical protein
VRALTIDIPRPNPPDRISFRHLSPEVPESRVISDDPRVSRLIARHWPVPKHPANRDLSARILAGDLVDRTQEVGGSSPPSSIPKGPGEFARLCPVMLAGDGSPVAV